MLGPNLVFVLLLSLFGPAVAFSQEPAQGECVLASAKNAQTLTVRGKVVSTAHDMLLVVQGCEDRLVLVYAGDLDTGVPSGRLRRDRNFTRFNKYVGATYKSSDKEICMQCPMYAVEATFTGRLDVATIPEGLKKDNLGFLHDESGKIVGKAGFGHPAPAYKYRLVIESVSDVVARKLPPKRLCRSSPAQGSVCRRPVLSAPCAPSACSGSGSCPGHHRRAWCNRYPG